MKRRDLLQKSIQASAGLSSYALWGMPSTVYGNRLTGLKDKLHLDIAEQAKAIKKTDHLVILLPEGSQANVLPCIELFKTLTGVTCDIKSTPVDDINPHMFASSTADDAGYDLALPATFGIPDLVENRVIADLTPYQEKYEPKSFSENQLYRLGDRYRDKFYGYQTDGDSYLLFFNQLLVDEGQSKKFEDRFGAAFTKPNTWQALDKQMAFFHEPSKNRYGGVLFRTADYVLWEWWLRFHAKGTLPLGTDLTPNIQGEAGVTALEELIKATEHLHPSCATNNLFENWKVYSKGECYANIGWGGTQKSLNKDASLVRNHLDFAVPPGDENTKVASVPYFNWGWNYTVSESSKHIELAYLFSLFSVCAHPSTLAVRQADGYFDPFREEHYSDEKISEVYSEAFLKVHKQSMTRCIPDFYMKGRNTYFSQLRKYLSLAVQKDISAEKALDLASKSWEKLHHRFGISTQQQQWALLLQNYKQSGFINEYV